MNGIFYLVALIILNMVLKNVQDKKNRESSKNKKISEASQKTMKSEAKEPSIFKELYTLLNEEIEKKTQTTSPKSLKKDTRAQEVVVEELPKYQKEEWLGSQSEVTESTYKDFSSEHYSRGGHRDLDEEEKFSKKKKEDRNAELKKDIVRGIIFSEILSEPKSLKKGW